jgi:hypothetical protein
MTIPTKAVSMFVLALAEIGYASDYSTRGQVTRIEDYGTQTRIYFRHGLEISPPPLPLKRDLE